VNVRSQACQQGRGLPIRFKLRPPVCTRPYGCSKPTLLRANATTKNSLSSARRMYVDSKSLDVRTNFYRVLRTGRPVNQRSVRKPLSSDSKNLVPQSLAGWLADANCRAKTSQNQPRV
jgi:hypothetical protein